METNRQIEQFKKKAAKLRELSSRYGASLSNAQALEILAKVEGARNWSAHSAALSDGPVAQPGADSEALLERALDCIMRIESVFGRAVDNDEEINGGDAVEEIVEWLTYQARPLLIEANAMPPRETNFEPWDWFNVKIHCEDELAAETVVLARGTASAIRFALDEVFDDRISHGSASAVPIDQPTAQAITQALSSRGITAGDLDEAVIESAVIEVEGELNSEPDEDAQDRIVGEADAKASGINNEGLLSQVTYLQRFWSPDTFASYLASTLNLKDN